MRLQHRDVDRHHRQQTNIDLTFFFFSHFAIDWRRWEEVSHDVKVWFVYLLADQKRKSRLLLSPTIRNRMDMGERRAHNQRRINTETAAAASTANGRTEIFIFLGRNHTISMVCLSWAQHFIYIHRWCVCVAWHLQISNGRSTMATTIWPKHLYGRSRSHLRFVHDFFSFRFVSVRCEISTFYLMPHEHW